MPHSAEHPLYHIWHRESPHRPHWPRTFEACIADPLTYQTLRLMRNQQQQETTAPIGRRFSTCEQQHKIFKLPHLTHDPKS